ncbi:MAG: endonuclease [Bacteroidaceae bacterium]|nr:endonuclease [Bacteroidaceae bacterium]
MAIDDATLKSYYAGASGKKGAALKTAFYNCISEHTTISYDGLHEAYKTSDRRPDGKLRDWYSNITNYTAVTDKAGSYKKEGDCYNREHSVPQSWFNKGTPMRSDLVHVIPTDGYVNNRRGNLPFGENAGEKYMSANAYSKVGACTVSGYTGQCFEPNDEIKGDIARIYFYMATCYENRISTWTLSGGDDVFDGTAYPAIKKWTLDMMMRWARQDPVDDVERERNEAVWTLQGNRNPYVDYPDLMDYVWGAKTTEAFSLDADHGSPVTPDNPDNPDTPDNPGEEATSGSIDLAALTWTPTSDATYGSGFKATANGMTLAYYTHQSANPVITVGSEMRLYKGSVFVISGGRIKGVTFHGVSSYTAPLTIFGQSYAFAGQTLTWTSERSVAPFTAFSLSKQVRITSIDVRISDTPTALAAPIATADAVAVFDVSGNYVGTSLPQRKGIYIVRQGTHTRKQIVR